jgi:hypothetical protein
LSVIHRDLVGVAEIAKLIGVTRQYAWQLSKRRDFPEPAYVLTAGHFWWLDDIEAWAARKGIPLGPPSE